MSTREFLLCLQKNISDGSMSVRDALQIAHELLIKEKIQCNDFYGSIDFLASLIRSESNELSPKALLHEIPESVISTSPQHAITESAASLIRIVCGKNSKINYHHSLKYWSGNKATVFYDPLMVGFSAEEDLSPLGWGSMKTGSNIARAYYHTSKRVDFNFKRSAIILTRHTSKYAHFIRDRLTKIIWAHHFSDMGPFDDYIFDYPLSDKELQCLSDLDIEANFRFIKDLGRIFTLQGDLIVIFEVSSGINLLPLLQDYMLKKAIRPAKIRKIYLSRGCKGFRRDACNALEVEKTMNRLGYNVVDLSDLSYVEQLNYCAGSDICTGIHGAQLINSLLGQSLIEIHSFPYCTSPWSETMLKMSRVLNMPYVPVLLSSNEKNSVKNSYECTMIKDIHKSTNLRQFSSQAGQTSSFSINLQNLESSIVVAESLVKKI